MDNPLDSVISGAWAGGLLTSPTGGWGAIPGAIIGGVAGGFGGSKISGWFYFK